MNAEDYIHSDLEPVAIPYFQQLEKPILYQDNPKPHTAELVLGSYVIFKLPFFPAN